MATFNKVNDFAEYIAEGAINLATDQIVVALSNTAPASETSNPTASGNGVLANVTQIAYTNLSSRNVTTTSSDEAAGTYTLSLADLTLTASGAVATFRYVYIYDDTHASDALIGYWDYGSSVTMANAETFDINFAANTLTIA